MLKELKQYIQAVCPFAKSALLLGCYVMIGYYIVSMISIWLLPYSGYPTQMYRFAKECLMTAPAAFVAAYLTALLCDIVYQYDIAPNE